MMAIRLENHDIFPGRALPVLYYKKLTVVSTALGMLGSKACRAIPK